MYVQKYIAKIPGTLYNSEAIELTITAGACNVEDHQTSSDWISHYPDPLGGLVCYLGVYTLTADA